MAAPAASAHPALRPWSQITTWPDWRARFDATSSLEEALSLIHMGYKAGEQFPKRECSREERQERDLFYIQLATEAFRNSENIFEPGIPVAEVLTLSDKALKVFLLNHQNEAGVSADFMVTTHNHPEEVLTLLESRASEIAQNKEKRTSHGAQLLYHYAINSIEWIWYQSIEKHPNRQSIIARKQLYRELRPQLVRLIVAIDEEELFLEQRFNVSLTREDIDILEEELCTIRTSYQNTMMPFRDALKEGDPRAIILAGLREAVRVRNLR